MNKAELELMEVEKKALENKENNVQAEDHIQDTEEQYKQFNIESWDKGHGYLMPKGHFQYFDEQMEGLESGLFLFAGESNSGKTSVLLELLMQYASNPENNLYGLYFSLDDTADKLIPRILASNSRVREDLIGVPISLFSKPQRYLDELRNIEDIDSEKARLYYSYLYKNLMDSPFEKINTELIAKDPMDIDTSESIRDKAYEWLNTTKNYFKVVDGTKISCGEELIEYCHNVIEQVRVTLNNPKLNLIVGIDSLSDITWRDHYFGSEKELNDFTSREIKRLAVEELRCPIFGSIHLRKIDQRKRPTIADVKESGRWVYEASLVFLVYNDVSRNKGAAQIYIPGDREANGTAYKIPVIELDWAKNKQSSFKGRTYCMFETDKSRVTEVPDERRKNFDQRIYGDFS